MFPDMRTRVPELNNSVQIPLVASVTDATFVVSPVINENDVLQVIVAVLPPVVMVTTSPWENVLFGMVIEPPLFT